MPNENLVAKILSHRTQILNDLQNEITRTGRLEAVQKASVDVVAPMPEPTNTWSGLDLTMSEYRTLLSILEKIPPETSVLIPTHPNTVIQRHWLLTAYPVGGKKV